MKHIWSVLCENSSIDSETNVISLFRCIEQLDITLPKGLTKKVAPISFELVHLWHTSKTNQDRNFEVRIELYDPENKKINEFPGYFTFPKNKRRMRTRMVMKGLPVTSMGEYTFKIGLKEEGQKQYKEVAEIPLDITLGYK